VSAHAAQKVHSKLQIIAPAPSGGRSASQHSQLGRICSMAVSFEPKLSDRVTDASSLQAARRARRLPPNLTQALGAALN
jgi:hypothetical protein